VFPSQSGTSGAQSPIRFGGPGGGGGGPGGFFARMMANNAAASPSGSNDRIRKQTQVTAVADLRTSSVVVTAQKDLIEQIDQMMVQLDVPSDRDQKVYVYHVDHGDPQQVLQVLQSTFGSSSSGTRSGTSATSQTSALGQRAQQNAQQMGNSSSTSSTLGGGNRNTSGNRPF